MSILNGLTCKICGKECHPFDDCVCADCFNKEIDPEGYDNFVSRIKGWI